MLKSYFDSQILKFWKFWKFSRIQSSKKVQFPCAKLVRKRSDHPSRLHKYIKLTNSGDVFRYLERVLEVHICHRKRPWRLMFKSSFGGQILNFWKFSEFVSFKSPLKVRFSWAKSVWKHSEHHSRLYKYI